MSDYWWAGLGGGGKVGANEPLADLIEIALRRQAALDDPVRERWVVVPSGVESIGWLLVANETEGLRRGLEAFGAFVGPALASVAPLNGLRPRDGLLAYSIELTASLEAFVDALQLMTNVRASAPLVRREPELPVALLVRDFYLALADGDVASSASALERLEATGLLDGQNLRFLRVERLARHGHWQELGRQPWLKELCRSRRPTRISNHLLEAVWRVYLEDGVAEGGSAKAWQVFESQGLLEAFGPLARSVDVPQSLRGRRFAAMVAKGSGDDALLGRVLAGVSAEERDAINELLAGNAVALPDQRLNDIRDLFDNGDYHAVVAAAESEGGGKHVALAVRAAYESEDAALAARVVEMVAGLRDDQLPSSAGFRRALDAVERLASDRCEGWPDWFRRLADSTWPGSSEVARDGVIIWDRAWLRDSVEAAAVAESLLRTVDGPNAGRLRATLDLLCDLAGGGCESPESAPFVDAVLLVLAEDENPSHQVRSAVFELISRIVASGPTTDRYVDLLNTLEAMWRRVQGRDAVPWVLDILDVLAAQACPDRPRRRMLVANITGSFLGFAHRLSRDELGLAHLVADDCEVTFEPSLASRERGYEPGAMYLDMPTALEATTWPRLAGRLVGVYSLTEGIGDRLQQRLRPLCREVRVEQNSDHVATERLRSLATGADYLIVDTKHATHSATGAIDKVRPRERQLFPSGGGMSSMLARLREALEADNDAVDQLGHVDDLGAVNLGSVALDSR